MPHSLFDLLTQQAGRQIKPILATKAMLTEVSHLLEDLVVSEGLPAVVLTGFQDARNWQIEQDRYQTLSEVARQVVIFAGGNLPVETTPQAIHVRLHSNNCLRHEWFVLLQTESFGGLLCGRVHQAKEEQPSDPHFDTFWTFEPSAIAQALELLRSLVAFERPDRLADLNCALASVPAAQPDTRLVTLFSTRLMDCMAQQHQQRQRLEQTVAQESRLRVLGQVLSGVAHELNNPLQSVLGFATLLMDDPYQSTANRQDIQHIIGAAERARTIVRNLLQLARQSNDERTAVDLADLIRKTLVFVRADLETARVMLDHELETDLPPVSVNPVRIQQMLINLISNAIQALEDQPMPRVLRITAVAATDSRVLLRIVDNGPGIPEEIRPHIFEPFFTTKPVGKGTGLGLSIVRSIVQEHQGAIYLSKEIGGGTAFEILLPTAHGAPAIRAKPTLPSGQGRILLIDDDTQIKLLIQRILERAGYTVDATSSTLDGLELLEQQSYDAIISDVLMPDMDGVEFYHEVLAHHPDLCERLVFITGDASRLTTSMFLQNTGVPFLLKPFAASDLLNLLKKLAPAVRG
ncbi:MAG TPA: ATP-binding protein [Roseiflexaceae bacterium]|nr:ATP-binding protein [Roseiflexaceae bacterium]